MVKETWGQDGRGARKKQRGGERAGAGAEQTARGTLCARGLFRQKGAGEVCATRGAGDARRGAGCAGRGARCAGRGALCAMRGAELSGVKTGLGAFGAGGQRAKGTPSGSRTRHLPRRPHGPHGRGRSPFARLGEPGHRMRMPRHGQDARATPSRFSGTRPPCSPPRAGRCSRRRGGRGGCRSAAPGRARPSRPRGRSRSSA